jgi:two-component sensor histidine kinase
MERYDWLKDSLQNQRQESIVQELNIKYEAVASKQKIAELELEQKNAALSLSKSRNQRNLFISGFVILIIIAGFLFYQYRIKKRTTDILSEKNLQISEALFDRETLLKEIHHRVKNNLQVISSLLYLQANTLEDEAAIDAVRQGEHRVKAMGLIHQRLYSADDVRGVDIQDYFEKLFDELLTAFGTDETDIEYLVNTNGLKLDIDTVIPLGLIINELITNAVKHAFREQVEGLIEVTVKEEDEKLHIRIKDNGVGMDEADLQKINSFGWKMMHSLSRKLKAEISIANLSGTIVDIIVARYKLVK